MTPSWWWRTSSARSKHGLNPHAAAHAAMGEVTRPIISIALVLCAVFVPVAFVSGLTGQFYRQFGITIAASTIISTFNSLTLSPALAALLLKPRNAPARCVSARHQQGAGRILPAVQSRLRARLGALRPRRAPAHGHSRGRARAYSACLLIGTWGMFQLVPGGFIPGAGQAVSDRHRAIAGCRVAGSHREGRAANLGAGQGDARRRSRHRVHRLIGTGLREFEQRGGAVLSAEVLR